jgi:Holliday junction resolvase RusA-like endonuclease
MIELNISGKPEGKSRPRFGSGGRVYTPRKTEVAEREIRAAWEEQGRPRLPDGPIEIEIVLIVERPRGHFNTKGELNKKGRSMPFPHNKKPDVDNAVKLVMDALNTRAYRDDVQICKATVTREWGDIAFTQIRLNELNVTRTSGSTPTD